MSAINTKEKRSGLFSLIWIMFLLLVSFFIIFFTFYLNNNLVDDSITRYIAGYTNPSLNALMLDISFLGKHSFLIPANLLLITFFIMFKKYKSALVLSFISLSSVGLMLLLKTLFHRLRPDNPLMAGEVAGYSFPSGHAFMSVVFYGLFIYWTVKYMHQNFWQKLVIIFFIFLILLIGFSRIYLRVHYTTDVLAGFSMGSLWLFLCLIFTTRFMDRSVNKNNISKFTSHS
jgi:undecaprenyl-diphosphatase